jgi:hypothetical protein
MVSVVGCVVLSFTMILLGFVLAIDRKNDSKKPKRQKQTTYRRYPTPSLMLSENNNEDDFFFSDQEKNDPFLNDKSLKTPSVESVRTPSIYRNKNVSSESDVKPISKKSYPIRSIIPIYSLLPINKN